MRSNIKVIKKGMEDVVVGEEKERLWVERTVDIILTGDNKVIGEIIEHLNKNYTVE